MTEKKLLHPDDYAPPGWFGRNKSEASIVGNTLDAIAVRAWGTEHEQWWPVLRTLEQERHRQRRLKR